MELPLRRRQLTRDCVRCIFLLGVASTAWIGPVGLTPKVRQGAASPARTARARMRAQTFGTQQYWEEFYSSDAADAEEFEWFCGYEDLRPFFRHFADSLISRTQQTRLLVAGCGNSRLTFDVYDDVVADEGLPVDIWNVDYAEAALDRLRGIADGRAMNWAVADLTNLSEQDFPTASFDIVLDKGTMDALFCAGSDAVAAATREMHRILRPGGRMIMVSGVPPAKDVLSAFADGWDVLADGSPFIMDDGEATINLRAHFYVFQRPG
ncbi:EEF1AKNMT [Symbiodinium natans]|uniref:EEF1AKNMT protein n=1 Tax=Symbiodinium natans TaxID=878477 RepID=A0A812IGQ3_9DINO|nr:EEF1AKNMT [Symbiodinium natans]